MHLSRVFLPLLASVAGADRGVGRTQYGLIGYGVDMYQPVCAFACQGCFRKNPVLCTDDASFPDSSMSRMSGMGGMGSDSDDLPANFSSTPSPACYAASKDFLTTQAWCLGQKCTDVPAWKLEKWWQHYVVGRLDTDPPPSISYGAALAAIMSTPTYVCTKGKIMNGTCRMDESTYNARYIAIDVNQAVEIDHERFALVALLSGVVIPVGFSLLRFVPFPKRVVSAFHGHLVYPYLLRPWRNSVVSPFVGDPPTRGQALFIGYLILLNVFLSAFRYDVHPGGFGYWWNNGPAEIMGDLANRLGVLSFANFVLLVLYSSRNNILLWLTDWQHSTFVLLHRWISRIAALQAILHSVVFLRSWIINDDLVTDQNLPYWIWGCIGTIAASLLLPFSIPIIRQRRYEVFLITHIALSILVFVGSWYHIIYKFDHQFGYETWLYAVFAVWGFDRLLRILRTLRYGIQTASITVIDQDYIRIDVKEVVATGHVYLYFLHRRFWENHPFSVASSVIQQIDVPSSPDSKPSLPDSKPSLTDDRVDVIDKVSDNTESCRIGAHVEPGMVFYLRLADGATRTLRNKTQVRVMIEGSYGRHEDLSEYPNLVCIAGGVGITSCLPYLRAHPGNTSLYWGSRSHALVDSLRPLTQNFHGEISIGKRLDLQAILYSQQGDFCVVVSGPESMMDETREIVGRLARAGKRRIKFVPESFSW